MSPHFAIRNFTPLRVVASASRCPSTPNWRRDGYLLSALRHRFKLSKRRDSKNSLNKHVTELLLTKRRYKTLSLNEILNTVQQVWKSSNLSLIQPAIEKMSDKNKKSSSNYANDNSSPILQRRRLSAPETIMRKHMLAQQRSNSQDTAASSSQMDDPKHGADLSSGSYPNLTRRSKDYDIMRKSTLLRRLWQNNSNKSLSRFSGSFADWQHSINGKLMSSGKSTQSLSSIQSSPEHSRKTSPQHKSSLNYRKILPAIDNIGQKVNTSHFSPSSNSPKTTQTETGTSTTTYTTDNSDFNYSNNPSSELKPSNNNYITYSTGGINDSSTQTSDVTNLNVISNVKLSDSTLDLIFNHVIEDMSKTKSQQEPEPQIINVQQVPNSFFLNEKTVDPRNLTPEHRRIVKYMISNIGAGSPYSKPPDIPQVVVPRFSALPRTTSMEVNVSSGDSEDKESDSISLFDSLEDGESGDKIIIKDTETSPSAILLPDNSSTKLNNNNINRNKKPASFFIPIEHEDEMSKPASLTDLLPDKVRDRLKKRQQIREEKLQQSKFSPRTNQAFYTLDYLMNSLPEKQQKKRVIKPILPRLETIKNVQIDHKKSRQTYRKKQNIDQNKNLGLKEKLTPIHQNVTTNTPNRKTYNYNSNTNNRRIEILEIMECIDTSDKISQQMNNAGVKSKIPVLQRNRSGLRKKSIKPTFLDLDQDHLIEDDPKLDQLIANILIDTLNNVDIDLVQNVPHRYFHDQNHFEPIPEESKDFANNNVTSEDVDNYNNEAIKAGGKKTKKTAIAVIKEANSGATATIPQGWITFYMLRKNDGTPDSTSDEGQKVDKSNKSLKKKEKNRNNSAKHFNDDYFTSNNNTNGRRILPPLTSTSSRRKKNTTYVNKKKNQEQEPNQTSKVDGEWSVIVSSSNNKQHVPELEMKLKFSTKQYTNYNQSQSDSGLGEENNRDSKFSFSKCRSTEERLPEIIHKNSRTQKRSESFSSVSKNPIHLDAPRQTRTSTRRYYLTRPKNYFAIPADAIDLINNRIIPRPPNLSVTGRSISPENKDEYTFYV